MQEYGELFPGYKAIKHIWSSLVSFSSSNTSSLVREDDGENWKYRSHTKEDGWKWWNEPVKEMRSRTHGNLSNIHTQLLCINLWALQFWMSRRNRIDAKYAWAFGHYCEVVHLKNTLTWWSFHRIITRLRFNSKITLLEESSNTAYFPNSQSELLSHIHFIGGMTIYIYFFGK